jgi:hypothetical protein
MAIYRTVHKEWEAKLRSAGNGKKAKKVKVASDASIDISGNDRKPMPRATSGKAGNVKGSLSLSQTLTRETDWWTSGTIDR